MIIERKLLLPAALIASPILNEEKNLITRTVEVWIFYSLMKSQNDIMSRLCCRCVSGIIITNAVCHFDTPFSWFYPETVPIRGRRIFNEILATGKKHLTC